MVYHWKKFDKFLLFIGCRFVRKKGDHRVYWRTGLTRPVVIPQDSDIPDFVIAKNLKTLGMTKEEFLEIYRNL